MAPPKTDLLIVILDVLALVDNDVALESFNSLILNRAVNAPNSSVILLLSSVPSTEHHLKNESPEYYRNIHLFGENMIIPCANVMKYLVEINKYVKSLKSIGKNTSNACLFEALSVAISALLSQTSFFTFPTINIIMFINGTSKITSDIAYEQLVGPLHENTISLHVFDFVSSKLNAKDSSSHLLNLLINELASSKSHYYSIKNLSEALTCLHPVSHPPVSRVKRNLTLEFFGMGNDSMLSLPFSSYSYTSIAKTISFKKIQKSDSSSVKVERSYHVVDPESSGVGFDEKGSAFDAPFSEGQTLVDKANIGKSFRYGLDEVGLSLDEEKSLQWSVPMHLVMLAIVDIERVRNYTAMGCTDVLVPSEKSGSSAIEGSSAFIRALGVESSVVLARYRYSMSSLPQLVILVPAVGSKSNLNYHELVLDSPIENVDCLMMIPIPWVDDIRKNFFRSFQNEKRFESSMDQLNAIDDLITGLDLDKLDVDTLVPNPTLYRQKEVIFAKNLASDIEDSDSLPPPNKQLMVPFIPEYNTALMRSGKEAIERVIGQYGDSLRNTLRGTTLLGRGHRLLHEMSEMEKELLYSSLAASADPLNLDQYNQIRRKLSTQIELERSKSMTLSVDDSKALNSIQKTSSLALDAAILGKKEAGKDTVIENFHVGSANPISDFTFLVSNSDQNASIISRAMNELAALIQRFVEEPYLHQKALACIRSMRQLSIVHNFASEFNNYLIGVKKSSSLNSTWKLLASSDIQLVSKSESSNVDVSEVDAMLYLKEEPILPAAIPPDGYYSEEDDGMGVE
jgi:Ku70/Ku80 beta-barrel domain/Ku C terminal domain like